MKKIVLLFLWLIAVTSCSEDEDDVTLAYDFIEVQLDSKVEIEDIIEFNNQYIVGGFDGFLITDQNFNVLQSYEEDMTLYKMIVYQNSLACVCTNQGIFTIDQANNIEKILELPCTDMEINKDGKILFISGLGELSSQRQISANILELDINQQSFSYYSDPADSIGVFLSQLEITDNGQIFTLSSEASIFRYQDRSVVEKYSVDNIDFFPPDPSGLNQQYMIYALGDQLYFTVPRHPRRLLRFDTSWQKVLEESDSYNSEKERLFGHGMFLDLGEIDGQCVIGTQNGLVWVRGNNEFDLAQYPGLSNQFIRKVYKNSAGQLMLILAGNIIAQAEES